MVADCEPPDPVTVKFKGLAELEDRPVTVRVLDPPAGIEDGLKVHVAALLQDNPIYPRNVLGPAAEIEKLAVVEPITNTLDRWLEERVKTGLPVPAKLIKGLWFAAFDAIVTLPLIFPELVGVKLTAMVQDWPTFKDAGTVGKFVPQLLVSPKLSEAVMLVMVTG
jgi:hypothetical protein